MLSTKKILYKICEAINSKYVFETHATSSPTSINAGTATTVTINCAKTGYTPRAFAGIAKGGAANGVCAITAFYLDGNNAKVSLHNPSSSNASVSVTVSMLYTKN